MGELIFIAFLALLGGISLGINRSLLGRVGKSSGAIKASVINHLGGACFLFFFLLFTSLSFKSEVFEAIPWYGFLGGIIGALFVMITSFVIPHIGVLKTSALFISGQMICGTLIDYFSGKINSLPMSLLGLFFILIGVAIGLFKGKKS